MTTITEMPVNSQEFMTLTIIAIQSTAGISVTEGGAGLTVKRRRGGSDPGLPPMRFTRGHTEDGAASRATGQVHQDPQALLQ